MFVLRTQILAEIYNFFVVRYSFLENGAMMTPKGRFLFSQVFLKEILKMNIMIVARSSVSFDVECFIRTQLQRDRY